MSSSLESMNSLLYHRYLKGESLYSDTYAPSVDSSPSLVESEDPTKSPAYHWDLQETCKPLFPAFDYISSKLSQEGLSIHLIVSDQCPFIIPIWQLPHKSQITLCAIIRKACKKFALSPSWMTALASLSKADLPRVFEAFKPDAYIIRRSMLQREIIYASEGLTLLSIDHIYTLKQLLCTLSKKEWVSSSRESCLDSCVHLLHRIHSVYTGKPASAAYIERVYKDLPFQDPELEEVVTEYNARYCTASIYKVSFQPDFSSLHQEDDESDCPPYAVPELPNTEIPLSGTTDDWDELVSPLEADLNMVRTWEAIPMGPNPDYDITSPSSVAYPPVMKLSSNTPPTIPPIATASQTIFPPPPSPPPSYPLPSPPYTCRSPPPSSRNTISSLSEETVIYDAPPSPLKINKRASEQPRTFPPPPNHRASTFPLLEPSVFSDEVESAVDGEFLWELNVLESPRSYIESWSSRTEGALCQRCHEVIGEPVGRRETI